MTKTIALLAGEQSGDNHGLALMKAMKELDPALRFIGVGGPKMRSLLDLNLASSEDLQVMGFSSLLQSLPRLFRLQKSLQKALCKENPSAIITIDFPDFNLRLAKLIRGAGYTGQLIHYISPSVWAWRSSRIHTMAKTLNLLLCIFPFEVLYFENSSLKAVYVGNPTLELLNNEQKTPEKLLAIFPGSRPSVVKANFPLQLEAAIQMGLPLAISVTSPKTLSIIQAVLREKKIDAQLVPESKRLELMKNATLGLATSGTIVLEMALSGLATVATYHLSFFNYLIAYHLFRIRRDFYVMPNILLKEALIPEVIGPTLKAESIIKALTLVSKEKAEVGAKKLQKLLSTDKNPASLTAAQEVLKCITTPS